MPPLAARDNLQGSTGSPRRSLSNSAKSPPRLGKVAAIQAANQRRLASNPDLSRTGVQQHGNSPRHSGNLPAPLVVESQRYEEWMKIATDNVSRVFGLSGLARSLLTIAPQWIIENHLNQHMESRLD